MSRKEVVRPGLMKALVAGQLTNRQVAVALRVSRRHVQRLKGRFRAAGGAGLVHRTRGRPSQDPQVERIGFRSRRPEAA